MCLRRALLVTERRFCGNSSKELDGINGAELPMIDRHILTMMMDPSTLAYEVPHWNEALQIIAQKLLKKSYDNEIIAEIRTRVIRDAEIA